MRTKKLSDSQVLGLAFEVISREGFESFTLEQVGKATALSPASLIKRFKSKKSLALLARNNRWDENLALNAERSGYSETGVKGLFKMVELIAKSVDSNRLGEHARWLGTESLSPQSKKKVSTYFAKTRSILQQHIDEAQKKNEITASVSSRELALNLEAFIQGVIFQHIFLPDRLGIKKVLENRVSFFLETYLKNKFEK